MKNIAIIAAIFLLTTVGVANATPLLAATLTQQTLAGAAAQADADARANAKGGAGGSVQNQTDGGFNLGLGISQAPTAGTGECAKGTKIAAGLLEWTDFSDKCLHWKLAAIAASQGHWELANQWVLRAEGN